MDGDWVCIHRRILDHAIFTNDFLFRLFVFCILKANWKAGYFEMRQIERGQFAASHKTIADCLRVNRLKVLRGLRHLEKLKMVKCENVNNQFTIVTVCNYGTYQDYKNNGRTASEQLVNNQRTTGEQPVNTIEQGKQGKQEKQGTRDLVTDLVAIWNKSEGRKIRKLTDGRKAKLRSRLSEPEWNQAFRQAMGMLPLPGDGWQPDFDWFVKNGDNVYKVLEGNYDWRKGDKPKPRVSLFE